MRGLRVLPFETLLFASETLAIGTHRLAASDPRFESYGPASAFLIVFPRNSTFLEYAGGDRFIGSPAVAPLYNRGQEYRRRKLSEEGDFCDWLAIAPGTLRELVASSDPRAAESDRPLRSSHVPVAPRDYLRQRAVIEHLLGGSSDPLPVEETMLDVVKNVLGTRAAETQSPRHRDLAHAATELLSRTFTHNVSLTQLARELGTTPFHLARTFRRTTGVTLHQHRLVLRLHESLALLCDTDRDLSTIALDLGFTDHSHFTMAFRRRFGVTPSRYRVRATFS
jgi:AraC family transcriptional regulator